MKKQPSDTPVFRRGPTPLSLNVGLAMAEYRLLQAQGRADEKTLHGMLDGIRKYQDHPFIRPEPGYKEIWRGGQLRILRHAKGRAGRPLLMVPSLINRAAILDLMPRRSFMRYLESRGHDVLLLDWGNPVDDPDMRDNDILMTRRLVPALNAARDYAGRPPDMLGYCMGGLLLLAACCVAPDAADRIVLLGMPWDFHAGDRRMLNHVASGTPAAFQGMAERGHLPQAWLQSAFAAMNADRAAAKFAGFAAMDRESAKARLFVAVEDWLNDGVDLPAGLARACIAEWYGENRPALKRWTVAGRTVDPAALAHDILVVAAQRDRLVPPESALALASAAPHVTVLRPDAGHIGMMAGQGAKDAVWAPVADWLAARRSL